MMDVCTASDKCSIDEPYSVHWKVLNRGDKAEEPDCIQGTPDTPGFAELRYQVHTEVARMIVCWWLKPAPCLQVQPVDALTEPSPTGRRLLWCRSTDAS